MYEAYLIKSLRSLWLTINGIATVVPGGLHYGRKVGAAIPYARFMVMTQKIETIRRVVLHGTYQANFEIYSENTSETDLGEISKKLFLDNSSTASLWAVLKNAVVAGTTIGGTGPSGSSNGKYIFPWLIAPPAESLQTEEERRSGRDIHVTRASFRIRVQWD